MGVVNICNQALLLLGEQTIQSLEEDSTRAKACAEFYESSRDACLRELKPSFARVRVALTALSQTPVWDFDRAYRLPQDCLLVIEQDNVTLQDRGFRDWRVEGRDFLTSRVEPRILYIKTDDDIESLMDGSFIKTLACYVAYEVAYAITNSNDKVSAMYDLYTIRRDQAIVEYGQESSTRDTTNDQLTLVR
jgi:hypothetical protein